MSFADLKIKFNDFIRRFHGPAMNIANFLPELRTLATEAGRHLIHEINANKIIPPPPDVTFPWLEVILKPEQVAQRIGFRLHKSTNTPDAIEAIFSKLSKMYSNACKRSKVDYGMAPPFACIFFEALIWLPGRYPLKTIHLPWVTVKLPDNKAIYFVSDFYGNRGIAPECATHFEIAMACHDACSVLATENVEVEGEWSNPMSKAVLMTRLSLKRDAFETFARIHGIRPINRQQWQIRLDKMDKNTRYRIEHGRSL